MSLILSNGTTTLNVQVLDWNETQGCKPSIRDIPLSDSQYIDTETWTLHPRNINFEFRASNEEKDTIKDLFDYKDRSYATLINGNINMFNNNVLYLPLNESTGTNIFDYSGSGFNGIISGGSWVQGKFGHGLQFSGDIINNHITLDNFLDTPSTLSLSAWVNLDDLWSTNHLIISKEGGNSWGFAVNSVSGKLIFIYTDNIGTERTIESDGAITFGEWYNIGVTYNGDTNEVCFYINGLNVGTKSCTYTFDAETNAVYIGHKFPSTDTWRLKGIIDDIRAWGRVISANEMLSIYKYDYQMWIYSGWISDKSINYEYKHDSHDNTDRPWLINLTMDIDVFSYTGS